MNRYLATLCLLLCQQAFGQDVQKAKNTVALLSSERFWGRGYTKNGMGKASDFILSEFQSYGLKPMNQKGFHQHFEMPVNTFPGKMSASINGKTLIPGKDFIVFAESITKAGNGKLRQTDSVSFIDPEQRFIVLLKDKLTWSVSMQQADYTGIQVDKRALNALPESYSIDIQNTFEPAFKASNICGIIPGTRQPDSLVIITAHYDHLGGMGSDTYFPGANDNASGVTFLLNLAKHYAKNPQPYSMGFICFAAEEAGLVGSKYFTENPLVPLGNIRFLINVDMVGTGEDGITVVNATQHPAEFKTLNQINDQQKYLPKINSRGKAANSDHYFFSEKGVPAFFIYTQGGISAYHDVLDKSNTLPLTEFSDLFKLFVSFNQSLMEK